MLLKVAALSRSTFYYQVKAQQSGDRHTGLKSRIRAVYERHKGCYGYRRITAALRQAGETVNHKTVQRLMQVLGLKSRVRPKKYRSYRGQQATVPNLLDRQFLAERPNQKWVTDVTEFNVRGEKLYLSPVMDLYNGKSCPMRCINGRTSRWWGACSKRRGVSSPVRMHRSCTLIKDGSIR